MTVHIIEPGLVGRTGHYFDYCLSMAKALHARGLDVVVHAGQTASADVGAAFLACGIAYDATVPPSMQVAPPGRTAALDDTSWLVPSQQWLEALATGALQDLWLYPTLQAASLFVMAQVPTRPAIVGLVHTPPRLSLWVPAVARLRQSSKSLRLLAIDPLITELTQASSIGLDIKTAPIPQGKWSRTQIQSQIQRVGFFGHQRPERGIDLLQPLVRALLQQGVQVLVHDSRGRLAVQTAVPGLELVSGYVDDFSTLIARCDMAVCPMVRSAYERRISGVAIEALACGVPVVLPSGTLVAQRWGHTGAVQTYDEHSPGGILRAVDNVRSNALSFAQGAQRAAREWKQQNGLDRFVDLVLSN